MAIQPERVLAHDFGETRHRFTARDSILYALGVGIGHDPLDGADLAFLDGALLQVLPTFAITLGSPGMWIRLPAYGVDFGRLLHVAQDAAFPTPLPAEGEVVATARVTSLTDNGEGRGAVLTLERRIADAASGATYCSLLQTLLLRGDGGFGGAPTVRSPLTVPERQADLFGEVALSPRAALIYRLSGDWNPLHADPAAARAAGFDRPIMHGLGTYAAAGVGVARSLGVSPSKIRRLACRFTGVAFPGQRLTLSIWREDNGAAFAARCGDRRVLDGVGWNCGLRRALQRP